MPPPPQARVLLLCHTPADVIGTCETSGLPLTISSLAKVFTTDLVGASGGAGKHFAMDLTRAMPAHLEARAGGSFDVISTMCCLGDALFTQAAAASNNGRLTPGRPPAHRMRFAPHPVAWRNVAKLLKPGGFFILPVDYMAALELELGKAGSGGELPEPARRAFATRFKDAIASGRFRVPFKVRSTAPGSRFRRWFDAFVSENTARQVYGSHRAYYPRLIERMNRGDYIVLSRVT
jgi:hypothetical protein